MNDNNISEVNNNTELQNVSSTIPTENSPSDVPVIISSVEIEDTTKDKKKPINKKILFIIGGIVLLIVIAVVIFFIIK